MPTPTFSRRDLVNIFAPSQLQRLFIENKRLSRIGVLLLICTLLAQGFLIIPVHKAKASPRRSTNAAVSQILPIVNGIERLVDDYVPKTVGLTAISELATDVLLRFKETTASSGEWLVANGKQLASQFPSILGFLAPSAAARSRQESSSASIVFDYPNIDYDFDGDGYSDIGTWRKSNADFTVRNSTNSTLSTYDLGSSSSAVAAPGNYDGVGATDAAIFAAGTWTYKTAPSATPQYISLGSSGDIPVAGDYDGNGSTDAAVYTPGSSATWQYKPNASSTPVTLSCVTTCGTTGDIPVAGDYDNDADTDIAVFRPSNGNWYISFTGGGGQTFHFGQDGDIPLQGDFDGDGMNDPAVYRPSTGVWYWANSSTAYATDSYKAWGSYADQPVPGNYLGDDGTDFAVWRPTTGVWYILENDIGPGGSDEPQYLSVALGAVGDQAIESAYIKQIGSSVTGDVLGPLRLKPTNATGGTNLNSQNFGWSTALVSLPGRAGMDLNVGIGYNSLVWIKNGSTMYFDPDMSNVTPGFRFGFAVIEPVYYDSVKAKWTYMMVTPTGSRVEFRQQGAGSTYETYDSSYTQLVTTGASNPNAPVEGITITVKTTDGTQMKYEWVVGAFRCTKIIDRNGNYISMTYDSVYGVLEEVTDTLGRVVSISYVENIYPNEITQTWKTNNGEGGEGTSTTTHKWAKFFYTTKTVATDWDSSITTVVGPPNSTAAKVLDRIEYADGTETKFDYNGYLQVSKVSTLDANSSAAVLNYISTNLGSPADDRTDCPRFTETKTWAADFNGGDPVTVENTAPEAVSFTGPNGDEPTSMVRVTMVSHPNQLYSRLYFGSSSATWREGLPIATEDCTGTDTVCSSRKRWTWNDWAQDIYGGTTPAYMCNPRVIETRVGDGTNTKRTTMSYHQALGGDEDNISYLGLVAETKVWGTDLTTTVLKTQTNSYVTSGNYVNRRIIGLPSETKLYQGTSTGTLMSKVTYSYDQTSRASLSNATNHDTTNYGTSFAYRGNLTETKRWDATTPTSGSAAVASQMAYNIAGSPVSQTDPRGRVTSISYTDSWNDSVSRTTYAYPTTLTDAGGNSSTIKYRFDFGANVWARSPTPYGTGNTNGKTTSSIFEDTTGRISKAIVENLGGAYTRYSYHTNGKEVTSYSTIVDADNDQADTDDEVETLTVTDGAGRVLKTRTDNPDSVGGYTGKKVTYDILGRVTAETVPTEINSSWTPYGDDSGDWKWNYTEYDWKGRPTRTIPSDSTGSDGKDTLFEYAGCGCAGGQVTEIEGPVVPRDDTSGTARRKQKVTEDILGRTVKTEVFEWNGSTVHSTTTNTYNGRDQITSIKEYAGTTSGTMQETTMDYDGHGRLYQKHLPQWYGTSPTSDKKYTTYAYNADDTVQYQIDPRGVQTNYKYGSLDETLSPAENRALLTRVAYTLPSPAPSPAIHDPADVQFIYDVAGNRKKMTDESGTLEYTYDELSRLKTETKQFASPPTNQPSGGYVMSYNYHLSGGVKSITAVTGTSSSHQFTYSVDPLGRQTKIGNASSATAYADGIAYRAFGSVKSISMSGGYPINVSMGYDAALRPVAYQANWSGNLSDIQNSEYLYNNDGLLSSIDNNVDESFTQENTYDFAGRLKSNNFGPGGAGIFIQNMDYDAFSNLTERNTTTWDVQASIDVTYANNRKSGGNGASLTYDNAANIVTSNDPGVDRIETEYDASGRSRQWKEYGPWGPHHYKGGEDLFDGDGTAVKTSELQNTYTVLDGWSGWTAAPTYHLYSSVTKHKIIDLNDDGTFQQFHVYYGGTEIVSGDDTALSFNVVDPVIGSMWKTDGSSFPSDDKNGNHVELAGLQTSVPTTDPGANQALPAYVVGGNPYNPETGCTGPGAKPMSCSEEAYAQRVADTIAAAMEEKEKKKKEKEALGVVFPKEMAKRPFAMPGQGPSSGLAVASGGASSSGSSPMMMSSYYNTPSIGEFKVNVEIDPNEEHYSAANGMMTDDPCDLQTVGFDDLAKVNPGALTILENTYGDAARLKYSDMGTINIESQATFLNTAAAINAQGINLSSAKFEVFYRGGKANAGAFGITLSGVSVSDLNNNGMTERSMDLLGIPTEIKGIERSRRSPGIDEGSLEATVESNGDVSFDVDLYNAFGSPAAKAKHIAEVLDNKRNNKTTHPADVYRKLTSRMTTGVSCK